MKGSILGATILAGTVVTMVKVKQSRREQRLLERRTYPH